MSARQVLEWLALSHGVGSTAEIPAWLDRVGLTEAADRRVRGFSVGMLQRLGVAAALMSRPDLIILDEPTSGMDPPGIQEMRALIRSLADDDDVTVVLASHQLLEVQKVCDRVAILNRGKLILEGAVSELTAAGGERLRLSLSPVEAALAVLGERGSRDDDGGMDRDRGRRSQPGGADPCWLMPFAPRASACRRTAPPCSGAPCSCRS